YGFNPDDLREADAIEVVIGQGAKPGGGGMLLGQKVSPRVAGMRTLPAGIDQRSACRHPDWTGPDDLVIKINELREITDWKVAITDYERLGTRPGYCHHCHTGKCPVGITTQDPVLEQRLEPDMGAKRLRNYVKTMSMELTTVARACGKSNVHHLEREDLVALTVEAAAMAKVPLAGTTWIPGGHP